MNGSPILSREDVFEAIKKIRKSLYSPRLGIVFGDQQAYNKYIIREIDASLYLIESFYSIDNILNELENILFRIGLRETKFLEDVKDKLRKLQKDIRLSNEYIAPQLGTVVIGE